MDQTAIKTGASPSVAIAEPGALPAKTAAPGANGAPSTSPGPEPLWKWMLTPLASLRLTVWLFALSMVIVFYGTWAQKEQGIWYIVDQYFRTLWVWIPIQVILCYTIDSSPFSIPFPGGWLLGGALMCNLLAAHAVRFKMTWKRSGIFILHAGIVIMMVSEFITGMWAVEGIMQIVEGQASNFTQDGHKPELAVIDVADPMIDDTVAIPASLLRGSPITHEKLPFDIEVLKFMANSVEVRFDPKEENPVTAGWGLTHAVQEVPQVSGAEPEQKYDVPAAIITLKDKATGKAIDTFLVRSFMIETQLVKLGDKTYEIALRPKRTYKPFFVHLVKADFKVYPGTKTPKDYSSHVRIYDEQGKQLRPDVRIHMNHPLYFQGETYFQASMEVQSRPLVTGLQVVYNPSLGMPLLSLVMVGLGMLVHFGMTLIDFLQRRMAT
jgi:hypothetical protein